MDRTARKQRMALVLLALVVAVALLVRWPVANRMLPELPEPDAFQVLHVQEWNHDPALVKHWEYAQRYPKLLTYVLAALPEREFDEREEGDARLASALACAAAPYQRARYVVLVLSLFALPLTWLLARRFTNASGALVATWLVATSLLHALFSTQARPHGVHLTAALLALWGALRIVERPTWRRFVVATLFAALAMATLQNGVFTLIPLALALFLSAHSWPRRIALAFLLPLGAAALAFTVYPVLPSIDATGVHLGGALSHNVFFSDFTFGGFAVVSRWFFGHDPVFCGLTLIGLASGAVWLAWNFRALLTGQRRHVTVVLAYVVPYSILLLVSQDVYERFLLPLLPWFAILAARPLGRIFESPGRTLVDVAARGASALLLAAPLIVSGRFAWVSLQPDTLRQAATWLESDAATRSKRIVATPYASLPLFIDPVALERGRGDSGFESRVFFAWQLAHPSPRDGYVYDVLPARLALENRDFGPLDAWIAERAPELVLVEISRKTQMLPALARLYDWTRAHGELVHRSVGAAPGRMELGLADYQSIEKFAPRLFGMSAFGPEIEIWRIAR